MMNRENLTTAGVIISLALVLYVYKELQKLSSEVSTLTQGYPAPVNDTKTEQVDVKIEKE